MAAPKIKIAFLLSSLLVGGTQKHVIDVITRLNREVFVPTLYGMSGGELEGEALQKGIALSVFREQATTFPRSLSFAAWRLKRLLSICRYLRQERPDILCCYLYPAQIWGGLAAKITGVPILITSRRSLGNFKQGKPHFQWLENQVNRFTDLVIANSEAVRSDALRRERLAPDKVRVVYNGVDARLYVPQAALSAEQCLAMRRELDIPPNVPVLGMIANLIPYKGHREFLTAAAEIQRDYPEARVVCVGQDCGIQAELERFAQVVNLRHLRFTGVSFEVATWLAVMDIYISASHEEGFSNAVLEAMAAGVPIIATCVGGTPEAIRDQKTGLLIPPNDASALAQAMRSLLAHPDFARRLTANARAAAEEHFSLERMVTNMEDIFLERVVEWRRFHEKTA